MNVLRVDRILEGVIGIQEYKNSVYPGSNLFIGISSNVWSRVDRIIVLLNANSAFQNYVNPQNIQRYASSIMCHSSFEIFGFMVHFIHTYYVTKIIELLFSEFKIICFF